MPAMNRRRFLSAAGLGSLAATAACQAPSAPDQVAAGVVVTGLEIFRVRVNRRGNWVIPRIQTSAGVSGIGDASHAGRDDPQVAKLQEFFELIKGRGIHDIEWLRQQVQPEIVKFGRAATTQ